MNERPAPANDHIRNNRSQSEAESCDHVAYAGWQADFRSHGRIADYAAILS